MSISEQIAIIAETPVLTDKAKALARDFNLPFLDSTEYSYPSENNKHILVLTDNGLELRLTGPKAHGPVLVDFTRGSVRYRREYGGGRKQPLAKAIGLKHGFCPNVLDATAGLGKDAFVLASLGCTVQLVERSPVLAALLQDGLNRAANHANTESLIRRMTLVLEDSIDLVHRIETEKRPDVIYLDPMYPTRTKSALVKKEMRMLRAVVGEDMDAPLLLKAAIQKAQKRVVVKRPSRAPVISGNKPSMGIKGKKSRFDVYLTGFTNHSASR